MFRTRRTALVTGGTALILTVLCAVGIVALDPHLAVDHFIADSYHRSAIASGRGPRNSERVAYVTITDETYAALGRGGLDRGYLARVHRTLARQAPAAVAYDIIFAHESERTASDRAFARALSGAGEDPDRAEAAWPPAFVSSGFALCDDCNFYSRESGAELDQLYFSSGMPGMVDLDHGRPYAASRGILPAARFARAARGQGHVSAPVDEDRILRHLTLLVRVGNLYLPTLAFAVFLDHHGIPVEELEVRWGRWLRVPAARLPGRDEDLLIPIDDRGRVYLPFTNTWNADFIQVRADRLLEHAADPDLEGNLYDLFAGRFVFVADVSTGVSDAADTALESRAPLVMVHAHLMNALLTGDFYARAPRWLPGMVVLICGLIVVFCAILRRPMWFYIVGVGLFASIFGYGYLAFVFQMMFVPVVTCAAGLLLITGGTLAALRIMLSRERTRDLQRLNTELVNFQHHLEDLVAERTRELDTSLKQIEGDLETARKVQQKILPPRDLELPGLEYHYEYLPLDRVGGDFIDIALVRPGVLRIFLADAVGHGVQASLLTMTVKSEYEDIKGDYRHPHELLEEYNRRLCEKYDPGLLTYIPGCVMDLHIEEHELRHASSGMPDQYLVAPDGTVHALEHTGPALGFLPDLEMETVRTPFPAGSRLLLFTDGLPETHDTAGDMFGEDRILAALGDGPASETPRELAARLLARMNAFRGDYRVLDDVTVLALSSR